MRGKARHEKRSATGESTARSLAASTLKPLSLAAGLLASASTAALAVEIAIPFIERTVTVPDTPAGLAEFLEISTFTMRISRSFWASSPFRPQMRSWWCGKSAARRAGCERCGPR